MIKPEIKDGVLVVLDTNQLDKDALTRIEHWGSAYEWPLRVHRRLPQHVVLKDKNNNKSKVQDHELIHFGSTADPSLHVGYVMLYE